MISLIGKWVTTNHRIPLSLLVPRCADILQKDRLILPELSKHLEDLANTKLIPVPGADAVIICSPHDFSLVPLTKETQCEQPAFMSMTELLEKLRSHGLSAKQVMTSVHSSWALSVMEMLQLYLDQAGKEEGPVKRDTRRQPCIQSLLHLNKCHGVLPTSVRLKNLTKEGSGAVSGGGFADIWKGRLDGTRSVCLKVLRVFTDNLDWTQLMRDLSNEILIWRQLQHPNILELLGIDTSLFEHTVAIVSPWMSNGTVMSFVRNREANFERKMRFIRGIVDGMLYLHEHDPPIIHGDIKGVNILVKDDEEPCIADFGLCSIEKETVLQTTSRAQERGSLPWLAPELMNPDDVPTFNDRSRDVYALGCTIAEVLSGSPPFSEKANAAQIILAVLLRNERPGRPPECPEWLWSLVTQCWKADPSKRLTVQEVSRRLNDLNGTRTEKTALLTAGGKSSLLPASDAHVGSPSSGAIAAVSLLPARNHYARSVPLNRTRSSPATTPSSSQPAPNPHSGEDKHRDAADDTSYSIRAGMINVGPQRPDKAQQNQARRFYNRLIGFFLHCFESRRVSPPPVVSPFSRPQRILCDSMIPNGLCAGTASNGHPYHDQSINHGDDQDAPDSPSVRVAHRRRSLKAAHTRPVPFSGVDLIEEVARTGYAKERPSPGLWDDNELRNAWKEYRVKYGLDTNTNWSSQVGRSFGALEEAHHE
ncbi:Homeobox protein tos8 [Marasmius tenuissimus]|uniref:Homeobox protein tos8 n=1 Tax=Marasmius tenuissimus TaxID=585030 RepID=A0ABR2ZKW8_9AGAR